MEGRELLGACVCLFPAASWWKWCELASVGWRCDSQAGLSSGPKKKGVEKRLLTTV